MCVSRLPVVAAATIILGSFAHVHGALLRKRMKFRTLVLVGMAIRLFTGGLAIVLAFMGFGVYALVIRSLVGSLLHSVALWIVVGWRPRAKPQLSSVGSMMRFGAYVTGTSFPWFFSGTADDPLIGKFLAAAPLGA